MIKIDFINFVIVGLFVIVWNAIFHLVNIEARRNGGIWKTVAAVAGMHS